MNDYFKNPLNSKFTVDKNFDIYNHLRYNLKHNTKLCELHESEYVGYCLSCKHPICEVCTTTVHSSHQIIMKDAYPQKKEFFTKLFSDFEKELEILEKSIQPGQLVKTFKEGITAEMDDLIEKLNDLKQKRLKEVEKLFVQSNYDLYKLRYSIKSTKERLYSYLANNLNFVDYNDNPDDDYFLFLQNFDLINELYITIGAYMKMGNQVKSTYKSIQNMSDPEFTKVSQLIDKLLLEQKKKEIKKTNEKIWESINSFNTVSTPDSKFATGRVSFADNFNSKRVNSKESKSSDSDPSSGSSISQRLVHFFEQLNEDLFINFRDKIDFFDKFNDNFKTSVFDSIKLTQSIQDITKKVGNYEEKIAKKLILNSGSRKINLNKSTLRSKMFTPNKTKISNTSLNSNKYAHIDVDLEPAETADRVSRSILKSKKAKVDDDKKIEEVDLSHTQTNDNDEDLNLNDDDSERVKLDVNIKLNNKLEAKKDIYRVIDRVFKPRQKTASTKVMNCKGKTATISSPLSTINTPKGNDHPKYKINEKLQEIISENQRITKMITSKDKVTLSVPIIRKYYSFKFFDCLKNIKEEDMEKKGDKSLSELFDKTSIENQYYSNLVIKVIEGGDEIHIYNKQDKKLEKRKVEIDIKTFNTKVFYRGCRWYHLQGKIYICGGKDFNGDKVLFMVYNIKDKKLHRLMDMKYPRSFHTLAYYENLRSLIAIGGENNNTCEMYDFYLNIWNDFPELNYSRAMSNFVVNEEGTLGYSMFGVVGDIVNMQLTDVIEVIDLIDLNKGWFKLEYKNCTGIDIKMKEVKVNLLPHNKALIYGGSEIRSLTYTTYLVLDFNNLKMNKLDDKEGEMLRMNSDLNLAVGTGYETIQTARTYTTQNKPHTTKNKFSNMKHLKDNYLNTFSARNVSSNNTVKK